MKRSQVLVLFVLCLPHLSHGQGIISFNNVGSDGSPFAPVYGPEANDPREQKWGNAADASPPGTQTYTGAPLAGTTYSVEAWYSLTPVSDLYALNTAASAAVISQTTFFFGGGYFSRDGVISVAIGTPGVYLQVRAWDNADGQYGSWAEAWDVAQAGSGRAVGWSKVFWQPLAYGTFLPPGLESFESFNIFVVPEPSTVALVGLGGLALMLFRRHK